MAITPLTTYLNSFAASSTLATANQLVNAAGGTNGVAITTKFGTASGIGEIWSQGTVGAWLAYGGAITDSACNPTGHGWFWDVNTLDGKAILAGLWTPTWRLKLSIGTTTATLYHRSWIYLAGVYTLIGFCSIAGQALTTAATTYPITAASFAQATFATNARLYTDAWMNITTPNANTGATVGIGQSTTSGTGTNNAQCLTPGFGPITPITGSSRSIFYSKVGVTGQARAADTIKTSVIGQVRTTDKIAAVVRGQARCTNLICMSIVGRSRSRSKLLRIDIGTFATVWKIRDLQAIWKTRDVQARWNTRDDQGTWKARK